MRFKLALFAILAPIAAAAQPAPGRYCSPSLPDIEIGPSAGTLGIDLMDCRGAVYRNGRVSAPHCFGMGGAEVPYDTDLAPQPDGSLLHDGKRFRLQPPGQLCQ